MRSVFFLVATGLLLIACSDTSRPFHVHAASGDAEDDYKSFEYSSLTWKSGYKLGVALQLSYKGEADRGKVYYNVKLSGDDVYNRTNGENGIRLRFVDSNKMILRNLIPGYTSNDHFKREDDGKLLTRRGTFELAEHLFPDIADIEVSCRLCNEPLSD